MTNAGHLDVDRALQLLAATIAEVVEPLVLTGTLSGVRRGRAWSRCELVAYQDATVVARLPVAIPPSLRLDDPGRLEGATVMIAGRFDVHPRFGPLQFIASNVSIVDEIAPALVETQRFLAELAAMNLLHANKRLTMVERPVRVGLIAPIGGGAGGADFLNRVDASGKAFQVVRRNVTMGGPAAPGAIAAALKELPAARLDAIIVCRGGGAASDLAVFDHPVVIEAICKAPVPVVVAVGHASDTTHADDVAHTSLPTPSAAAAWLIDLSTTDGHRQLMQRAQMQSISALAASADAERAETAASDAEQRARRRGVVAAAVLLIAIIVVMVALAVVLSG